MNENSGEIIQPDYDNSSLSMIYDVIFYIKRDTTTYYPPIPSPPNRRPIISPIISPSSPIITQRTPPPRISFPFNRRFIGSPPPSTRSIRSISRFPDQEWDNGNDEYRKVTLNIYVRKNSIEIENRNKPHPGITEEVFIQRDADVLYDYIRKELEINPYFYPRFKISAWSSGRELIYSQDSFDDIHKLISLTFPDFNISIDNSQPNNLPKIAYPPFFRYTLGGLQGPNRMIQEYNLINFYSTLNKCRLETKFGTYKYKLTNKEEYVIYVTRNDVGNKRKYKMTVYAMFLQLKYSITNNIDTNVIEALINCQNIDFENDKTADNLSNGVKIIKDETVVINIDNKSRELAPEIIYNTFFKQLAKVSGSSVNY